MPQVLHRHGKRAYKNAILSILYSVASDFKRPYHIITVNYNLSAYWAFNHHKVVYSIQYRIIIIKALPILNITLLTDYELFTRATLNPSTTRRRKLALI